MEGSTRSEFCNLLTAFSSPLASCSNNTANSQKWQPSAAVGNNPSPMPMLTKSSGRQQPGVSRQLELEHEVKDDVPLDDFDRNLLAEIAAEQEDASEESGFNNRGPSYSLRPPAQNPSCTSRRQGFQTSVLETPPFRGLTSSSSEIGTPSSPSLAVKARIRNNRLFKTQLSSSRRPDPAPAPDPSSPDVLSLDRRRIPSDSPAESQALKLRHAPQLVQGIPLVSTHELPDRFRSLFTSFPMFNAVQSKCFPVVYHGDHNVVLSAPTGSGKTVVMELSICRLLANLKDTRFKVVYMAPTKSLCSERFRDWRTKFSTLDLQCAELTGDTNQTQMRNVQNASIIITTPEKWDSMTRKWKDHARLMQLIKLFLIDEVHILKESRGATLEAVVSRMKSVNSNVRFVALSATVPNSEDIATWLGRDPTSQHLPAHREKFGEEFRPVKLQKYVYGYQSNGNDFVFDKVCDSKLSEVISKHSARKPIMIFCCTRNSAITTSKNLAKLWHSLNAPSRMWKGPTKNIAVQNVDLRTTISAGVAFHHAGLDSGDRKAVEDGYIEGQINVICCTSTLAVGVNLPCHLVIIKNTVTWQDTGCKEYADLEMMQMLGRAGRPQFDDSAVAVILTRKERVGNYEKLVAGTEQLESCLHLNLIDHLNAEIGLGTITDVESAAKWLMGTYFFVRLHKNPVHYKLKEGSNRVDEEEMLTEICEKDIKFLQEASLVTPQGPLKSTEFGDAMARYYVKFETMRLFLSLPPRAKISEILSVIAQADEFREIRLKGGEKSLYKEINKGNGIKFPIKVGIALAAHKISLLIQSELGAVEIPTGEQFQKHKLTFQQDKGTVFSHVNRLIRCIIDCQLCLGDSVSTRNALELARSFGAKVWENSALQMKQIDQIGVVAVRKLANAGINSIEALESTEAHRIEMALSKNPPFGSKLLARLADFPKPRVSVKMMGKETKPGKPVKVKFRADIGFINEKVPTFFQKRQIYLCFLAETSDGQIIDFRRISATKLQNGHDILLSTDLTNPYQYISCYVMCDEIAGTLHQAELKPAIAESLFPAPKPIEGNELQSDKFQLSGGDSDEFADEFLNDGDLLAAAGDLEWFSEKDTRAKSSKSTGNASSNNKGVTKRQPSDALSTGPDLAAVQLENGKWACNHKCKDKTSCKHFCCREGTDRPPRLQKKKADSKEIPVTIKQPNENLKTNKKLSTSATREKPQERSGSRLGTLDTVDLTADSPNKKPNGNDSKKPKSQGSRAGEPYFQRLFSRGVDNSDSQAAKVDEGLSFPMIDDFDDEDFEIENHAEKKPSSDYGSILEISDDVPSPDDFFRMKLGPENDELESIDELDNLADANGEQAEEISDEAISILEDELTDYEQYVIINEDNAMTDPRTPVFSNSGNENGSSPHPESTNTTISAIQTIFSPADKENYGPRTYPSSDSFFFNGDSNIITSSTSKRPHCQDSSTTGGRYETPCKKRRVTPLETISPSTLDLCANVLTDRPETGPERVSNSIEEKGKGGPVDTQGDMWDGIDPSLLEEYKDFVNFL